MAGSGVGGGSLVEKFSEEKETPLLGKENSIQKKENSVVKKKTSEEKRFCTVLPRMSQTCFLFYHFYHRCGKKKKHGFTVLPFYRREGGGRAR